MDFARFIQDPGWEVLGLVGQITFGCRFVYQWLASEVKGRSIIPVGFWYLSIIGTILIFIYAFHKGSIAFMIPTLTGLPIYIRNLVLVRREQRLTGPDGGAA